MSVVIKWSSTRHYHFVKHFVSCQPFKSLTIVCALTVNTTSVSQHSSNILVQVVHRILFCTEVIYYLLKDNAFIQSAIQIWDLLSTLYAKKFAILYLNFFYEHRWHCWYTWTLCSLLTENATLNIDHHSLQHGEKMHACYCCWSTVHI